LITENNIKQEDNEDNENSKSTKRIKTQSTYTNWFAQHLWTSIFANMKKHSDLTSVFHYLKTLHRKQGEVSGQYIYEKVNKGSFYEWFTPKGKLKPHLKEIITKGIASNLTHFSILETRLKLKDELNNVSKNI
jgi:hypothetical protein